jgi:hypothetical protein
MRVDVASGEVRPLLEAGRRVFGQGIWGSVITSQAWAPDNRRLVYMNDEGHAMILDTVTGAQEDLGIGTEPTWSPDGRFIAIKMPRERGTELGKRNEGDYMLIRLEPTREQTLLLSNPRPFWRSFWRPDYYGVGYDGPALWLPDGRFLIIRRAHGEVEYPYVLDQTTGEIAKLPPGYWGHSWGGKP